MSNTTPQTAEQRVIKRILRVQEQLAFVREFLDRYTGLLVSLSDEAMTEKMGSGDDVPYIGWWTSASGVTITVYGPNQRETMRTVRRAIGGKWDKHAYGEQFSLSQNWTPLPDDDDAPRIYVSIHGSRDEVCQKVVIGVEEVHHDAVEARPARTEFVDKVEWVCGNLLED